MSRGNPKNFTSFLSGEIDMCPLFIEREKGSVSSRYSIVDEAGNEVLAFWKRNGEKPFVKKKYKGEYTGGQKPYAMLLQEGLERLRGNTSPMNIGFLALLSSCIEMGTGRLRHKRSKKSMTLDDISEHLYISRSTAKRFVKDMSELGVISYERGKGYYISRSYLLRGAKRDETGKSDRADTDSART